MPSGYNIGQLVAEIQIDTSTMSQGIADSNRLLGSLNGEVGRVASAIQTHTNAMGTAFQNLSAKIGSSVGGVNSAVRQMGNATNTALGEIRALNTAQLSTLTSGFNSLNASIHQSNSQLAQMNAQLNRMGQGGGLSGNMFNSFRSGLRGASNDSEGLFSKLSHLSLYAYVLYQDLRFIGNALETLFGRGLQFTVEMENATIGMGAIMASSMKDATGADVSFNAGMMASKLIMQDLRTAALQTTATMSELVNTFQGILGPGTAMGMNVEQLEKFTVIGVNAVKAMGLRKDQMVQELRAILSGNINARSATIATALGITNADMENAKAQGKTFEFLEKRFSGFQQALSETAGTFNALWSNLEDGLQQTQEKGFAPFFAKVKNGLATLQKQFFDLKYAQEDIYSETEKDDNGNAKKLKSKGDIIESSLNENTVAMFAKIGDIAGKVYDDLTGWALRLTYNDTLMNYLERTFSAVGVLIATIYDNFDLIVNVMTIMWAVGGGIWRVVVLIAGYFQKFPELLQFVADHLETIIIAFTAWELVSSAVMAIFGTIMAIGAFSLPAFAGGLAIITAGWTRIVYVIELVIEAVQFFGAVLRITCMSSLGIIGGVVFAIYELVMALRKARSESKDARDDAANLAGTGQISTFQDETPAPVPEPESTSSDPEADARENRQHNNASSITRALTAEEKESLEKSKFGEEIRKIMNGYTAKYPHNKDDKGAAKAAKEELQRQFAVIDGLLRTEKDRIKNTLDQLQTEYDDHLVGIEGYYNKKIQLAKESLEADELATKSKLALETDPSNIEKLQASLKITQDQLASGAYKVKLLREEEKAYKNLNKELDKYNVERMEEQGDVAGVADSKWNTANKENLESFKITRDELAAQVDISDEKKKQLASLILICDWMEKNKAKVHEVSLAEKAVTAEKLRQSQLELGADQEKFALQQKVKAGLMSELDYNQQIYEIEQRTAEVMIMNRDSQYKALELASKTNLGDTKDPEKIKQAQIDLDTAKLAYEKTILSLQHPISYIAQVIKTDMLSGLTDGFTALIMRTKSVSQAFSDMATSILNSIAKIMSNRLSESIVSGLFSGLMGGGTSKSFTSTASLGSSNYLSQAMSYITSGKKAGGGYISGEGTGTSDSIHTMLSNGEFVIRAKAVKQYGVGFFDKLNGGQLPKLPAYAGGGLVSSSSSSPSSSTSSSATQNMKIEIINQTGTDAKVAKTETKFDGVQTVISLWLEGVSKNVGGSKDMIKGMGGR